MKALLTAAIIAVIALPTLAAEMSAPDLTPYLNALSEKIAIHADSLTSAKERQLLSEGRRAIITGAIRGYLDRGHYKSARAILADKKYDRDLPGDLRNTVIKEIRKVEIEQNTMLLIAGIYDKSIKHDQLLSALQSGQVDVVAFKRLFDILTTLYPKR